MDANAQQGPEDMMGGQIQKVWKNLQVNNLKWHLKKLKLHHGSLWCNINLRCILKVVI
jgi:thiamine pyrophosphokinase